LSYTLPESQQNIYVRLTAGSSVDADRFSAYRSADICRWWRNFRCRCPVITFQEISARQFVLFNANYLLPLDGASVEPGCQRGHCRRGLSARHGAAGNSLTGAGGGIFYRAPSDRLKIMLDYAFGVNACGRTDAARTASAC